MNLTPEELEALRKKEERKDKLHQAYLRRKANGTQKRYEDKIKEKKRAEIEAKKAAIRAKDMENGVFIPASSLPMKEPRVGKIWFQLLHNKQNFFTLTICVTNVIIYLRIFIANIRK